MIVVKVGGSDGIDYDVVCVDFVECWQVGEKFILVYGGSGEINWVVEVLGYLLKFVMSLSGYILCFIDW